MSDYAGAKLAIRERLEANWNLTRIAYPNETPADPWPPTVDNPATPNAPEFAPWLYLEIVTSRSELHATGKPGNLIYVTYGLILVHVFTPAGEGDALATQYASDVGEIFRSKKFYDAAKNGCYVRTWAPRVDEGGPATSQGDIEWSNTGAWYRVTMSVSFEYWHRG